ncbi:TPA: rRNA maturation RNase YbeY [Candidatus Nomurabacteria bacterium]|nr:MAG: Endoribonuclease YbeY [Parcubacteria bacterium RAAC4_OD1_1]HCY26482.1 rRNA maturation RNase YbeY [Candidatus Nomurabacteria bacterium]
MDNKEFCTIKNETKGKLPSLPFVSIKEKILGKKYDLSIIFLKEKDQKKINRKYRGKNKSTNILSFPLEKLSGEITFDPQKVKKDAPLFKMRYREFLKLLFIHGCLHLKGFEHSSRMEKEEQKFMKMFS